MEEAKIIRFLIRTITFFRNLIFILDGSVALILLVSCKTKVGPNDSMSYFQSKSYQEYVNKMKNKNKTQKSDQKYITIIGESEFLNLRKGDFYIIYFYKASRDSLFNIYTIKSIDGLTTAAHKIENINDEVLKNDDLEVFKCSLASYKIDYSSLNPIKEALEKAIGQIKNSFPSDYDNPLQFILYFNGEDYYRLSPLQLEQPVLNNLDSAIRKFKPFSTENQ